MNRRLLYPALLTFFLLFGTVVFALSLGPEPWPEVHSTLKIIASAESSFFKKHKRYATGESYEALRASMGPLLPERRFHYWDFSVSTERGVPGTPPVLKAILRAERAKRLQQLLITYPPGWVVTFDWETGELLNTEGVIRWHMISVFLCIAAACAGAVFGMLAWAIVSGKKQESELVESDLWSCPRYRWRWAISRSFGFHCILIPFMGVGADPITMEPLMSMIASSALIGPFFWLETSFRLLLLAGVPISILADTLLLRLFIKHPRARTKTWLPALILLILAHGANTSLTRLLWFWASGE